MPSALRCESGVPLANLTTLNVGGCARYFCSVATVTALREALVFAREQDLPWLVIGGGSNLLVSDSGYDGVVISLAMNDEVIVAETDETVMVRVEAGVMLDEFIARTVAAGWWGLENLSAIPGTVGATPVQNVGAYGVEVGQVIECVEVYDTNLDQVSSLARAECAFGYRTSYFKQYPNRYIILSVTFVLAKLARPQLSYADLTRYFVDTPLPTQASIRQAVEQIRSEKFPDWRSVGTAGSFFKNPMIPAAQGAALQARFPDLPVYVVDAETVKLSLGYILDKVCGLKGYREGAVRLYERQALVLVADEGATASDVLQFAAHVTEKVFLETGVMIEREVSLV